MSSRVTQLLFFMTTTDEQAFSAQVAARFPKVTFIDGAFWETLPPPTKRDVAGCSSMIVILLDQAIVSFDDYTARYTKPHPSGKGYLGGQVGAGLMQFWRSTEPKQAPGHLENGRVAASYDTTDSDTDALVKGVSAIVKKGGRKLYAVDVNTNSVADRPDSKFVAWPDAAARYNGEAGRYLTHASHFFVARE